MLFRVGETKTPHAFHLSPLTSLASHLSPLTSHLSRLLASLASLASSPRPGGLVNSPTPLAACGFSHLSRLSPLTSLASHLSRLLASSPLSPPHLALGGLVNSPTPLAAWEVEGNLGKSTVRGNLGKREFTNPDLACTPLRRPPPYAATSNGRERAIARCHNLVC